VRGRGIARAERYDALSQGSAREQLDEDTSMRYKEHAGKGK
jgi:hypothetical protein